MACASTHLVQERYDDVTRESCHLTKREYENLVRYIKLYILRNCTKEEMVEFMSMRGYPRSTILYIDELPWDEKVSAVIHTGLEKEEFSTEFLKSLLEFIYFSVSENIYNLLAEGLGVSLMLALKVPEHAMSEKTKKWRSEYIKKVDRNEACIAKLRAKPLQPDLRPIPEMLKKIVSGDEIRVITSNVAKTPLPSAPPPSPSIMEKANIPPDEYFEMDNEVSVSRTSSKCRQPSHLTFSEMQSIPITEDLMKEIENVKESKFCVAIFDRNQWTDNINDIEIGEYGYKLKKIPNDPDSASPRCILDDKEFYNGSTMCRCMSHGGMLPRKLVFEYETLPEHSTKRADELASSAEVQPIHKLDARQKKEEELKLMKLHDIYKKDPLDLIGEIAKLAAVDALEQTIHSSEHFCNHKCSSTDILTNVTAIAKTKAHEVATGTAKKTAKEVAESTVYKMVGNEVEKIATNVAANIAQESISAHFNAMAKFQTPSIMPGMGAFMHPASFAPPSPFNPNMPGVSSLYPSLKDCKTDEVEKLKADLDQVMVQNDSLTELNKMMAEMVNNAKDVNRRMAQVLNEMRDSAFVCANCGPTINLTHLGIECGLYVPRLHEFNGFKISSHNMFIPYEDGINFDSLGNEVMMDHIDNTHDVNPPRIDAKEMKKEVKKLFSKYKAGDKYDQIEFKDMILILTIACSDWKTFCNAITRSSTFTFINGNVNFTRNIVRSITFTIRDGHDKVHDLLNAVKEVIKVALKNGE